MDFRVDEIVDYQAGNEMHLGLVVKLGEGRVQLKSVTNDTIKVPHKQVLCSHGTAGTNLLKRFADLQNEITACVNEIDTTFLWESYEGAACDQELPAVSTNYFGDDSALHLSALIRKLSQDTDHFQRIGWKIHIRTPQEVQEIVQLRAARAERAEKRQRTIDWLAQALNHTGGDACPVPEEQEKFLQCAIDYLMLGSNTEAVNLLATARAKSTARETALRLLRTTHRMPEGVDEFLLVNGIHSGFSSEVQEASQNLSSDFARDGRTSFLEEEIFSVDDDETREIDDALSCRLEGDRYIVGIYIADPATYVKKDDVLDLVAQERPLSLYLPTTMVKMFPERVSCELASLLKNEERPALAFRCEFSMDGELEDWSLSPAYVKLSHRLNYDDVDKMLLEPSGSSKLSDSFKALLKISEILRKYRLEDGAVILNRPELRIRVKDGEITVREENQDSPSHRLVSEFMILINNLAAKYALHNEVPVIYRVQEAPSGDVHSVFQYEPYFFEQQVRQMKKTRLSTYPESHFGLGLDLYIQISSPLRRYADLVLHRQLSAKCLGQPLPYTQEELFVILDNVERTSAQNRSYEREANGYWLFEFLKRNFIGKKFGATVVRVEGSLVLAEIDKYCARGVVMTRDKPAPGERINVLIKEVVPDTRRMVLIRDDN